MPESLDSSTHESFFCQARPTTVREVRLGVALAYPNITLTVEPSVRNTIPSPERRFSGYSPKCLLLDTETVHGLVHQAKRSPRLDSSFYTVPPSAVGIRECTYRLNHVSHAVIAANHKPLKLEALR